MKRLTKLQEAFDLIREAYFDGLNTDNSRRIDYLFTKSAPPFYFNREDSILYVYSQRALAVADNTAANYIVALSVGEEMGLIYDCPESDTYLFNSIFANSH